MSFTAAALIVVGLVATLLGLACYHLLGRLDRLEQAVLGGLTPPSRRLSREQFEQRFGRALQRSRMAARIGSGVIMVVGAETDVAGNEIAATLTTLDRTGGLHVLVKDAAALAADNAVVARFGAEPADPGLGVPTTPWVFVIDQGRVTASKPVADAAGLIEILGEHT